MVTSSMARSVLLLLAMLVLMAGHSTASPTSKAASKIPPKTSETASKTASKSAAASTGSATHTVKVGAREDPHQYDPPTVDAKVGDVVVFEFYPRNHSVVKADYMAPCVPAVGDYFYSGMFNSFNEKEGELSGPPPTWSLTVNDTEPTFFYCTALESCNVNGMVGVINPNETMTWHAQYEKAKKYPYQVVPGHSPPTEGTEDGSPSPGLPQGSSSGNHTRLSGGAIAGIVVGALAFVAILVILFFILGRNRVYRQWMSSQDARTERTARWALFNSPGDAAPSTRKSEIETIAQPMADHPATYASSPDPTHVAISPPADTYNPYMSGSPPPQQVPGVAGVWNWDMMGVGQQQQQQQQHQPPPPPPPAPIELDSNSRK